MSANTLPAGLRRRELPIGYAARFAAYGKRAIFQNQNVLDLHEVRLPARFPGMDDPRPWAMEFEGREYATREDASRDGEKVGFSCFFDTWDEAEEWLREGVS